MKKDITFGGIFILLLLLIGFAHADVWYVHPDSALNSIQAGLDSCAANDTVLVAPGTYYENLVWPSTQGIDLLSEAGPDSTIIDGSSIWTSVIEITTGIDTTTVIKGFTIQHGKDRHGGGIYCNNVSPIITNNIITENSNYPNVYDSYGGGIYCRGGSPIIRNNFITDNIIEDNPGSGPVGAGGGICCCVSDAMISQNIISDNHGWQGGGIACLGSQSSIIINNFVVNNSAWRQGGGILCSGSLTIMNNVIGSNTDDWDGGGITCYGDGSFVDIINNIITENSDGLECVDDAFVMIINTIFWDNCGDEMILFWGGTVTISYSDVQEGQDDVYVGQGCTLHWGEGMIDADPIFVSGPLSDYHLCPFTPSPCIDSGDPDPQYNDPEDPLNPGCAMWPALGTVRNDMGVYGGPGTESWVGVIEKEGWVTLPRSFNLKQNYPNPFSSITTIRFNLNHAGHVVLNVYNVLGQKVAKLVDKELLPGEHSVVFNAQDLASGVYYYHLQIGKFTQTKRCVLIK